MHSIEGVRNRKLIVIYKVELVRLNSPVLKKVESGNRTGKIIIFLFLIPNALYVCAHRLIPSSELRVEYYEPERNREGMNVAVQPNMKNYFPMEKKVKM